jgi:hypothetical protein
MNINRRPVITKNMKQSQSFHKHKLSSILMLIITLNSYSQNDTLGYPQKTDTLQVVSEGSRHALYSGIGYGSNMIYLGSTISHNRPFGYTALSFGFDNEFYATVSAIHLSDTDPLVAFYTGALNYNHAFNSWFDISGGVYRYQVHPSLADTLLRNLTYGDLTLGVDLRLIYSRISVGTLLSDKNQTYFQIRNSRYFQTPEFSRNKFFISFDPYINLLLGPRYKIEPTTETYPVISPTNLNQGSNSQNTTSKTSTNGSADPTNTTYSMDFGVMEIDFGLPVSFGSDRLSIEAEASYVLSLYNDAYLPGPKGFVFIMSCFFRIF